MSHLPDDTRPDSNGPSTPAEPVPIQLTDLRPGLRLIETDRIRLAEILAAFSDGLDLAQGKRPGHSLRTCLIGMRLAQVLRLDDADSSSLFYALLMKDLGCTTTAPKLGWILSDHEAMPRPHIRLIDWTNPHQSLRDCWKEAKPGSRDFDRLVKVGAVLKYGEKGRHHISRIRGA